VTPASADDLASLVVGWFAVHARDLPWRRPGFPPWGTLVSEFMLQQTPVVRVIPRLDEWLTRWPEPADLAAEPAGEAVRAWQSLGYPRRALNLYACAVAITERFDGAVPNDIDALLSLPGVGDYTARAVAVFAFGARHPVVDTNIRRVIARAVDGHPDASAPNAKRDLPAMAALLPADDAAAARFNAGTMELGALVCTARSPKCEICPLAQVCAWRTAGYPDTEIVRKPKQKKYEGSDRQARGAILKLLRASAHPVPGTRFAEAVPNPAQRGRALTTLLQDGLIVAKADDIFTLP
jgi:A/G-specific adenine glycosylase